MGLLIRGLRHWCRDHRQGITPVDDLSSRIVYSQDFVGGDGQDHYGHGEHIAGIVAANGISSSCPNCTRSLVGIAPGARLINLRALDENGNGSDSTVIAAIEQAIRLKNQYNIRVMNLSLGRPVFESFRFDPLCQAVEAAWRAGIVVVVAAGNGGSDNSMGTNGYGTITVPGNDPYVITVGAMKAMGTFDRTDDRIASYSSKGPTLIDHVIKPDLVAPGNQVVSLRAPEATLNQEADTQVLTSYYQNPTPGAANVTTSPISMRYSMLNGTSMAAAVTSAAVADLLSAQPNLTPEQVKARLMKTAYKTFRGRASQLTP
jgi:serine protease AprX